MDTFLKYNWPQAIVHIDGDSFFVSCEQALNPKLEGRPVVTGSERGIASAMSPEAKRAGITRGMPIYKARELVSDLAVVSGDYETYAMFAKRMYDITRRYTSEVEKYSIDECFADITGLRRSLNMTYQEIALTIKKDLQNELGITFSVGLAPTKTLAKVGSKWDKPDGFTVIPGKDIKKFLRGLRVEDIWGIGWQTSRLLNKKGIRTALEFAEREESWVRGNFSKPFVEKWKELRGISTSFVDSNPRMRQKSISKTRSFVPATRDKKFLLSRLSQNVENACFKARRFGLAPRRVFVFLKTEGFHFHALELRLNIPTSNPSDIMEFIEGKFDSMYRGDNYRATGVTLAHLEEMVVVQPDLFSSATRIEATSKVYESIDEINNKYGRNTVRLASSFQSIDIYREKTKSKQKVLEGTKNKKLSIPYLGIVK